MKAMQRRIALQKHCAQNPRRRLLNFASALGSAYASSRRSWGAPLGHRTRTFREEYLELLRRSGVEFDERYV